MGDQVVVDVQVIGESVHQHESGAVALVVAGIDFPLSPAFKGAKIAQPSFFIWGKADGLKELYPLTIDQMRAGLPGLVGGLELDNVGHWVQHEAADLVSDQLVTFLRTVKPA